MGRSLLRIRLPCPRLCHPPLDPRLGAQGVLPPVPLARPTSHERAGIAAAQNGRARGQSLTTTQPVLCNRTATVPRCGSLQGTQSLPSLCCRLEGSRSPSRGPKRPHRSLVLSGRRSPASSYLICSRGRGVVIYLGPAHGVISQARTTTTFGRQSRGRRTGWSGDPVDSKRRLRVCASKRRRARGR